jgi:hypothetical protein
MVKTIQEVIHDLEEVVNNEYEQGEMTLANLEGANFVLDQLKYIYG